MVDIKKITDYFTEDIEKVNKIIMNFASGKSPLIHEISSHLVNSGGKRIRPLLLMIANNLFHHNQVQNSLNDNVYYLASAIEMIHTATLLHDDVVDNSEVRRGKKTANSLWDNKSSILVGDYLFSIAFQLMVKTKNIEALALLSKVSSEIADGEVMQLENFAEINLTIEKYLEIINSKTAILFSASTEVAGIINSASCEEIDSLKIFGKNLGIIFQIVDDILDYIGDENSIGKQLGDDFFEGKITLPIIITIAEANKINNFQDISLIKEIFLKNLSSGNKDAKDFELILELVKKYQSIKKSLDIANHYYQQALNSLTIFQDSIAKEHLKQILTYAFQRIS
jgi:octaprenyl-diphosphate synthase